MPDKKSQVAFEANYLNPAAHPSAQHIGIRAAFSVTVLLAAKPADLREASAQDGQIIFWLARPDQEKKHTLVSIGQNTEPLALFNLDHPDPALMPPLVPTGMRRALDEQDIVTTLGGQGTQVESVTVWLEAPAGDRVPLPVGFVGHADTLAEARQAFPEPVLLLRKTKEDEYQVLFAPRVPDSQPAPTPPAICAAMRDAGGIWSKAADFANCPA